MLSVALAAVALAAPATGHGERTCAERAEPSAPDAAQIAAPLRFFLGYTDELTAAHLRGRNGRYRTQKAAVDVVAGKVVTLSVAPASRRRVSLLYDQDLPNGGWLRLRDGHRSVTFTACRADQPMFSGPGVVGPRTGFPGGLIAAGRQCARFTVKVAGEPTTTVTVPLGKRC